MIKTSIDLHTKCPLFLSDFTKLEFSRHILEKCSNIKFHKYLSSGSRVLPCGQTDGETYMTKRIVAFRNFANALKKSPLTSYNKKVTV